MTGYVNSIQTLGTLDGPGVRFTVFMQGCPLRCGCCHNPETRKAGEGAEWTPQALAEKAMRYKEYFGQEGGVTLSGGEPLLQAEFAAEFFALCKQGGINTCLDTSGCLLNGKVEKLLKVTDRVLLDIKYTTDEDYKSYVGCSISEPLKFLEYLSQKNIPVTVRQVIIPELNGNKENIERLKEIALKHPNVDKIELLPFKKLCAVKYENMGIEFPFESLATPTAEEMEELNRLL